MECNDSAGNVASTFGPPLHNNPPHSPPTSDATAATSTTRNRIPRDSRLMPDEGASSESLVYSQGSSDGNQPVTPSPLNDSYLHPLMQWHEKEKEKEVQHSCNSLDSAVHLHAPLSSLPSSSTKNDTQHRPLSYTSALAFPLPPEIVKDVKTSHSKPCQRSYAEPPVGQFPLPTMGRAVPSHLPRSPPPTWPAWVVAERHVQPPYTSPYDGAPPNTRQKPATNHGLHTLATVANYEATSPKPHSIDFNNYVAATGNPSVLRTPPPGPHPVADPDHTSPHCLQIPSINSSAPPVFTRRCMKEEDSPGQGRKDKSTVRKQEAFRRKAENLKEQRRSSVANKTPTITFTNSARKRESLTVEPSFAVQQTVAPAYRNGLVHSLPDPYFYNSNSVEYLQHALWDNTYGPYTQGPIHQYHSSSPGSWGSSPLSCHDYIPRHDYTYRPPDHPPPPPTPAPDPDDLDQPITTDYSSYRWSAKLYTIDQDKTGHQYAESWIEALFEALDDGIKRHTHVTQGFIEGGNQCTFLILHNAADPFRYGSRPSSTVSIGCYGFHWYDHTDIRWTTLATDLRYPIKQFMLDGLISEVKKWHPLMQKAKEKRFHRAYWLAATMSPLGAILNRKINDTVIKSVEAFELCDDDFEITELNLNNEGCELSTHLAERRWKECEEIAESEVPGYAQEHIVTGSSEC